MLTDNSHDNYTTFFADAVATGCVWGLQGQDGWAQSASEKYPEVQVIPFWSQLEYAEIHQQQEWASYQAVAIDLEEFMEEWLPGMHRDVILAGLNWNGSLEGEDNEPLDVLQEFERLLA